MTQFNLSLAPLIPLWLIVALAMVFTWANPRFGSVENLQNLLYQAAVPLIVVVGTTM